MSKKFSTTVTLLATSLVALSLAGCGGGTTSDVVVRVGGSAITKPELSHWMTMEAGGDFYELSGGHTVPAGLVSDPPDYAGCVARLQASASSSSPKRQATPVSGQLLSKCRQLYQQLKLQALEFLVYTRWAIGAFGDLGISVSDQEVTKLFNHVKAEQFPRDAQRYLGSRRRSLSDELLLLKMDVLSRKAYEKLTGGSKQANPKMLAKFAEAEREWTAKTDCQPGYVVKHCRQYTGPPTSSSAPSGAVLLEQVAVLTGRPCINRPACA